MPPCCRSTAQMGIIKKSCKWTHSQSQACCMYCPVFYSVNGCCMLSTPNGWPVTRTNKNWSEWSMSDTVRDFYVRPRRVFPYNHRWPYFHALRTGRFFYISAIISINKKFWEELIVYFPWYYTDHIENDASNSSSIVACVLFVALKFLPSRCLWTTREFLLSRCLTATEDTYMDTQNGGKDLWSRPLRWAQMSWYTYQVS
jgi:hypothetical protein